MAARWLAILRSVRRARAVSTDPETEELATRLFFALVGFGFVVATASAVSFYVLSGQDRIASARIFGATLVLSALASIGAYGFVRAQARSPREADRDASAPPADGKDAGGVLRRIRSARAGGGELTAPAPGGDLSEPDRRPKP